MATSTSTIKKRKGRAATVAIGGGLLALVLAGAIAFGSGSSSAKDPKPPPKPPKPKDPPVNPPIEDPEPEPEPEIDPGDLWGVTPPGLRQEFERTEEAAGIDGLGSFLAVWSWGAFRAKKAPVSLAEAAKIAAANPELCRKCHNTSAAERTQSKKALDRVVLPKSQGGAYEKPWPGVADYAGWTDGSYGLFDLLAGAQAHAGYGDGKFAPLIDYPATILFQVDVQCYIAGYIVFRIVNSPLYKVLVDDNPLETWSNIRAVTASPQGFVDLSQGKKTASAQVAAQAKQNCIIRAAEMGIDLAALPMPFNKGEKPPWGWPGAKAFFAKLDPSLPGKLKKNDKLQQPEKWHSLSGFDVLELGTEESGIPLIVGLHGITADVDQLKGLVAKVAPKARIALVRGNQKSGSGYRYFATQSTGDQALFADQLDTATASIVSVIDDLRNKTMPSKVIVVGVSQGGHMAYMLAREGIVDGALVIAGTLPESLYPKEPTPTVVRAVHGLEDAVVPYASASATAGAFADVAADIALTSLDTGHSLSGLSGEAEKILGEMVG